MLFGVDELQVIGVYVGTPQVIGTHGGKPVRKAIALLPARHVHHPSPPAAASLYEMIFARAPRVSG